MTLQLGRGSLVVQWPEKELFSSLVMFRHTKDGGEYEELFTYSPERHMLVTLPGFANRLTALYKGLFKIRDERTPMPEPDFKAALGLMPEVWRPAMEKFIAEGGGIMSIPDLMGPVKVMASILRAFPRDRLLDRGTPISLIAARDSRCVHGISYDLRRLLPDREIGVGPDTDSEDIIIVQYEHLDQVPRHLTGVLIADDAGYDGSDINARAEGISGIRNAARFGIISSPAGGDKDVDIAVEGLFGPLTASATYDDAVKAKAAVPVTVCWMPCPRPNAPLVSADLDTLSALAMHRNRAFVKMVSDIMRETPPVVGCLMTGHHEMLKRISKTLNVAFVTKKSYKHRKVILDDIASGVIRKALLDGYFPESSSHGVMISATCGGADAVQWFPWRELAREGDKVYIVDFHHKWDMHNGRPGRLARNDEARERRYADMGFSQIQLEDVKQLPFL